MTARDGRQLRQALAYARHGWPVFPVAPGQKIPATPRGFKDATTDQAQIRAWWAAPPGRNIGIATGHPGPDVIDVDQHGQAGNGFAAWNQARRAGLADGAMAIVRTPSGGMHAYYTGTGQRCATITSQHLDFRAAGGYIVAPHSTVDGRPYVVVQQAPSTATVDFTAIRQLVDPQPGRQALQPRPQLRDGAQQNLDHLIRAMGARREGDYRNAYLFWAANRILDHHQPERLDELADAAVAAGLPRREVDHTIRSAQQQTRQDPHATPQPRPSARASASHDGRRGQGPADHCEREGHASKNAGQPPEHHSLGPVMEADRDEPEHQIHDQANPAGQAQPGRGAHVGNEAATRGPGHPESAVPGPEHPHEPDPTGATAGEAGGRPFEPEPEPEAGE
jgi:Bifunctional DNA primase/polymerase, N-terminal